MTAFVDLLRSNRNYRYTWFGQVVSEIGDHFNAIAAVSLAVKHPRPGLVVTGMFLARTIPTLCAGPISGVVLDRFDRRHVMIASDLLRAVTALGFVFAVHQQTPWLLYALSAVLMFASPFFMNGRSSILPTITTPDELHVANTMTQTTSWASLTIGAFLGAAGSHYGLSNAFVANGLSFLISALCITQLRSATGFRARGTESKPHPGLRQYREGLRYMAATPMVFWIAVVGCGRAVGGGAGQILFGLFGQTVFHAGSLGIGLVWGFAGIGLLGGGAVGYWLGKRVTYTGYKRAIAVVYVVHSLAYVLFSQMPTLALACLCMAISRAAVGVGSLMNFSQLLRHVEDQYRGRVFSTVDSLNTAVLMSSMIGVGASTTEIDPRRIAAAIGILTSITAILWIWADATGRIAEPARQTVTVEEEAEIHAEPQPL